jgi:5,10-methylene-tetrahydrofolate dehydrogenase/methenyl tetrahydrofolate cyclohydrolase
VITGDVDFDQVSEKASLLPVPGVGPMTIAMLKNTH